MKIKSDITLVLLVMLIPAVLTVVVATIIRLLGR